MNLVPSSPSVTMSSREIADLVEQRHDNVKRTIDTLVSKSVIIRPQFEDEQSPDAMGRQRTTQVYRLGKRDSLIVVAQLCPEFTAKIVDRWQELESAQSVAIPRSFSEALRLAAIQAETIEKQEAALLVAAPKLEAFNRIAEADGCLGLQEAGKALQQKPNKFIGWLREKGWIYRRAGSGNNLGHAEKVNAGYVTHKVTTVHREDGSEKVVEQALITPKGLAKLAMMLNVNATTGGAA